VLRCVGKLVQGQEATLLCAALQRYGQRLVADLSAIDEIDAASVGALLTLLAAGVYFQLANPSPAVQEFLRSKAGSIFEIISLPEESRDAPTALDDTQTIQLSIAA
jgi:anti-anti-sigma regulatory factor